MGEEQLKQKLREDQERWKALAKLLRIPKRKMLRTMETYHTLDALVELPCCQTLTEKELWKVQEFVRLSRAFLPKPESPIDHVIDLWELVRDLGITEKMWIVACVGNQILKPWPVGHGAVDHVVIPTSSIISYLLRVGAHEFFMVHSHPPGFPLPSPDDLELTRDIARAAQHFDLKLMDHIVVTPYTIYSIAMSGEVEELPCPSCSEQGCLFVMEGISDEVAGIPERFREGGSDGVGDVPERPGGAPDGPADQDIP